MNNNSIDFLHWSSLNGREDLYDDALGIHVALLRNKQHDFSDFQIALLAWMSYPMLTVPPLPPWGVWNLPAPPPAPECLVDCWLTAFHYTQVCCSSSRAYVMPAAKSTTRC
ncbi:hypothetical protein, partial [Burkholderia ubonensis]|uniref:hypothetical protein n=1 Tax=Burkholderia ubonensis TaxID=101571 RepID=UPI001E2A4D49